MGSSIEAARVDNDFKKKLCAALNSSSATGSEWLEGPCVEHHNFGDDRTVLMVTRWLEAYPDIVVAVHQTWSEDVNLSQAALNAAQKQLKRNPKHAFLVMQAAPDKVNDNGKFILRCAAKHTNISSGHLIMCSLPRMRPGAYRGTVSYEKFRESLIYRTRTLPLPSVHPCFCVTSECFEDEPRYENGKTLDDMESACLEFKTCDTGNVDKVVKHIRENLVGLLNADIIDEGRSAQTLVIGVGDDRKVTGIPLPATPDLAEQLSKEVGIWAGGSIFPLLSENSVKIWVHPLGSKRCVVEVTVCHADKRAVVYFAQEMVNAMVPDPLENSTTRVLTGLDIMLYFMKKNTLLCDTFQAASAVKVLVVNKSEALKKHYGKFDIVVENVDGASVEEKFKDFGGNARLLPLVLFVHVSTNVYNAANAAAKAAKKREGGCWCVLICDVGTKMAVLSKCEEVLNWGEHVDAVSSGLCTKSLLASGECLEVPDAMSTVQPLLWPENHGLHLGKEALQEYLVHGSTSSRRTMDLVSALSPRSATTSAICMKVRNWCRDQQTSLKQVNYTLFCIPTVAKSIGATTAVWSASLELTRKDEFLSYYITSSCDAGTDLELRKIVADKLEAHGDERVKLVFVCDNWTAAEKVYNIVETISNEFQSMEDKAFKNHEQTAQNINRKMAVVVLYSSVVGRSERSLKPVRLHLTKKEFKNFNSTFKSAFPDTNPEVFPTWSPPRPVHVLEFALSVRVGVRIDSVRRYVEFAVSEVEKSLALSEPFVKNIFKGHFAAVGLLATFGYGRRMKKLFLPLDVTKINAVLLLLPQTPANDTSLWHDELGVDVLRTIFDMTFDEGFPKDWRATSGLSDTVLVAIEHIKTTCPNRLQDFVQHLLINRDPSSNFAPIFSSFIDTERKKFVFSVIDATKTSHNLDQAILLVLASRLERDTDISLGLAEKAYGLNSTRYSVVDNLMRHMLSIRSRVRDGMILAKELSSKFPNEQDWVVTNVRKRLEKVMDGRWSTDDDRACANEYLKSTEWKVSGGRDKRYKGQMVEVE